MTDRPERVSLSCLPLHAKRGPCQVPLHKKYRSHFEIIASMLEAMRYVDATTFTLMKQARVSYRLLRKYLEHLAELGFLETNIRRGRISYRTSNRGIEYLQRYRILEGMLSPLGQSRSTHITFKARFEDSEKPQHVRADLAAEFLGRE